MTLINSTVGLQTVLQSLLTTTASGSAEFDDDEHSEYDAERRTDRTQHDRYQTVRHVTTASQHWI